MVDVNTDILVRQKRMEDARLRLRKDDEYNITEGIRAGEIQLVMAGRSGKSIIKEKKRDQKTVVIDVRRRKNIQH